MRRHLLCSDTTKLAELRCLRNIIQSFQQPPATLRSFWYSVPFFTDCNGCCAWAVHKSERQDAVFVSERETVRDRDRGRERYRDRQTGREIVSGWKLLEKPAAVSGFSPTTIQCLFISTKTIRHTNYITNHSTKSSCLVGVSQEHDHSSGVCKLLKNYSPPRLLTLTAAGLSSS